MEPTAQAAAAQDVGAQAQVGTSPFTMGHLDATDGPVPAPVKHCHRDIQGINMTRGMTRMEQAPTRTGAANSPNANLNRVYVGTSFIIRSLAILIVEDEPSCWRRTSRRLVGRHTWHTWQCGIMMGHRCRRTTA